MLTVEAALAQVLTHAAPLAAGRVPLPAARGLILAEGVKSDIDSPPHDKSLVDGYAVLLADLATGTATLRVLEEITAGEVPHLELTAGSTTRIMTGAPLPVGAEAVVMIEQSELQDDSLVRLTSSPLQAGQNIMRRATSLAKGAQVLAAGTRLRAIEIGVLAEVGQATVPVIPRPRVACLATGNELVPVDELPPAGKIRNSNGPLLAALIAAADATPVSLGIARDERAALEQAIQTGLDADVLLLSGGVSAGVLDLVPSVLADLGVKQVFHKVLLKPGKPLWFGVAERHGRSCLVFGLPGNPVSTLVCYYLFVRPALDRLAGRISTWDTGRAMLAADFHQRGDRPTFHPARVQHLAIGLTVETVRWHGSGDLAAVSAANCLALFPAGQEDFAAGEEIDIIRLN